MELADVPIGQEILRPLWSVLDTSISATSEWRLSLGVSLLCFRHE